MARRKERHKKKTQLSLGIVKPHQVAPLLKKKSVSLN
jgi:hypothetical protein